MIASSARGACARTQIILRTPRCCIQSTLQLTAASAVRADRRLRATASTRSSIAPLAGQRKCPRSSRLYASQTVPVIPQQFPYRARLPNTRPARHRLPGVSTGLGEAVDPSSCRRPRYQPTATDCPISTTTTPGARAPLRPPASSPARPDAIPSGKRIVILLSASGHSPGSRQRRRLRAWPEPPAPPHEPRNSAVRRVRRHRRTACAPASDSRLPLPASLLPSRHDLALHKPKR
jgi:hypothetical protein